MEVIGSHTYVLRYRSQVSTPIEKWPSSLIAATRRYVEKLLRCRTEPELAEQDLRTFVAKDLAACSIFYFAPYEAVIARTSSRSPQTHRADGRMWNHKSLFPSACAVGSLDPLPMMLRFLACRSYRAFRGCSVHIPASREPRCLLIPHRPWHRRVWVLTSYYGPDRERLRIALRRPC